VRLGRRVRIWHHGGIVLHARSIGNDVHIRHNTTFGIATRDRLRAISTIENWGAWRM
jgi:serine O-acetyltransferase